MKTKSLFHPLSPEEEEVIVHKGTERPNSGKYNDFFLPGTYVCKRCHAPLYRAQDKFPSHCGWPSFDDEITGAVKHIPDSDGLRIEIVCSACGAHLGHVFTGEGYTAKNTRHCVNSISMDFIPQGEEKSVDKAVFAGGCFWGVEHLFQNTPGVIQTKVGYTGGHAADPTYRQVSGHATGHAEAVEVAFDPERITYEKLVKLFFEIHDFTQVNRQGPDVGEQYRSAIFYLDEEQKKTAKSVIRLLEGKGWKVATQLVPAGRFWPAEPEHQNYFKTHGNLTVCHVRRKIFE